MTTTKDQYGNKVYQLGQVKATLIPFDSYQKVVAALGVNQAQDIQPDGRMGFVANIEGGNPSEREVDANETTIQQYLWDLRGAELALITMRADIDLSLSGYVRDLMSNTTEEQYKINRIIAAQSNHKIAAELQAWADKWIA